MKKAFVTGVSRGIGREIAKKLVDEGYNLYGVYKYSDDYQEEKAEADSLEAELKGSIELMPFDLVDKQNIQKIIEKVGSQKLDAIVNDAGEVFLDKWEDMLNDNWDRTIAVNMEAPLWLVHGLRNNLKDGGSVVNVASTDAYFGGYDTVAYAASKAGLISITKSLANILGPRGIRVNAIAPGWVETPMVEGTLPDEATYMTPLGRNAKPAEIADLVSYLLSDKSSFVTGSVINVDGGMTGVDYTIKKEAGL